MKTVFRPTSSGVTLVEVLISLGLVTMIYGLVGFTTIQLARFSRSGQAAARAKLALIEVAETMRWQLRSVYQPSGKKALEGTRTGTDGRDVMRFYTNFPREYSGVVEVGYRVESRLVDGQKRLVLLYREFPFRLGDDFRPITEREDGPWKVLNADVSGLSLEYSADGIVWQREWVEDPPPAAVHVKFLRSGGGELEYRVIPGLRARRW